MDSIVKIVLALKLKFLLIVLSIGTSYLVEHKLNEKEDPASAVETIEKESHPGGSGNINARTLFKLTEDSDGSRHEPDHHLQAPPESYITDRPFSFQGLEISIEF